MLLYRLGAPALLALLLVSCAADEQQKNTLATADSSAIDKLAVDKLIYALPSPNQALELLKGAGAHYDPQLVNASTRVTRYQSTVQAALNVGVYSTDLAYVSTFDQSQESVGYFTAIQKLADQLGIASAFNEDIVRRLDRNKHNKDSVLAVVTDAFTRANNQLQKNKQGEITNLILAGGFVEGLYLACQVYKKNPTPEVGKRIAEQKLALQTLFKLLDKARDMEGFGPTYAQLQALQAAYSPIQLTYSYTGTPATMQPVGKDKKRRIIHINNQGQTLATPAQLDTVLQRVGALRQAIIS